MGEKKASMPARAAVAGSGRARDATAAAPRLNPAELRAYARRDWDAPERLSRRRNANRPVADKVRLATDLSEAARATRPDWPNDATRRADLETHLRVRALLDRAAHVGAR